MRVDELVSELHSLTPSSSSDRTPSGERTIIGLVGPPGVGKSTVADQVLDALGEAAALLPMDGFHLSNEVLRARGSIDRKGAPDTFDAAGFVATLARIRADDGSTVYAPRFHREFEESVAAEISIEPHHRVVLTEGNYLLFDEGAWAGVRPLLDRALFLRLDQPTRQQRLIARHIEFGKSSDAATEWTLGTDERNAELINASASRADDIIDVD